MHLRTLSRARAVAEKYRVYYATPAARRIQKRENRLRLPSGCAHCQRNHPRTESRTRIEPIHEAQLLTYMRLAGMKQGFLINFNVRRLKDGLKSFVL